MSTALIFLLVFFSIFSSSATSAQTQAELTDKWVQYQNEHGADDSILFSASTSAVTEAELLNKLEQDTTNYSRNLFLELGKFQKYDPVFRIDPSVAHMGINARVNWLIDRASKPDADFRFAYALAVYRWKLGDTQEAAFWLAKADLRAFIDAQRCEDKSSPPSRISPWRAAAKPIYEFILKSPNEYKVGIRNVVELEQNQVHLRTSSAWMCSGGTQQLSKLLKKYPELSALDASKPVPQAILDKYPSVINVKKGSMELTDFSIPPDFKSEEIWKQELPTSITAFKQSYFATLGIK